MKTKLAMLAATVAGAILLTAAPAQAAGGLPDFASAVPPNTVEVVNKLPSGWPVLEAVKFVDKYTGSKMKVVKKCSGKARACITVKQGYVKNKAAYTKGSVIKVDVYRTQHTPGWKGYYNWKTRYWLLAHELGHARGLGHLQNCTTVMDSRARCGHPAHVPPMKFNAKQKKILAGM